MQTRGALKKKNSSSKTLEISTPMKPVAYKSSIKPSKKTAEFTEESEDDNLDEIENDAEEIEELIGNMVNQMENLDPRIRNEVARRLNHQLENFDEPAKKSSRSRKEAPIPVKVPSKRPPAVVTPPPVKKSSRIELQKRKEKTPPVFNGEDNLSEWILQYEMVSQYNQWSEDEMIDQLPFAVSGIALSFVRNANIMEKSWEEIKQALEERFISVSSEVHYRSLLKKLSQNKGESVNSFIGRLETISSNLKTKLVEDEMKTHFLEGLLPQFRQQLILFSHLSWKDLQKIALQLDGLKPKNDSPVRKSEQSTTQLAPPVTLPSASSDVVSSASSNATSLSTLAMDLNKRDIFRTVTGEPICKRCKRVGHMQYDCNEAPYYGGNVKNSFRGNSRGNKFRGSFRGNSRGNFRGNRNRNANVPPKELSSDSKSTKQEN